jgi:BirA family transcriptional regulator, biotin operon repressor / biotin---[acetyl-CoA-carboxylase] ligase
MIIGSGLIFSENLSSTNLHAAALLKHGNPAEGTIVHTNFQTAGKGQMGNSWESEDGKNLLISIILYPVFIKADQQFVLSEVVSLGITDFLSSFLPDVFIKWPNDIYFFNDKIAGILIENSIMQDEIESSIAGIGLNINQERFVSGAPNPTSLRILTGKNHDLSECLKSLAAAIDKRYKQLLKGENSVIDKEYITSMYRYGSWNKYSDDKGLFEGRITGVTPSGKLLVEDRKGKIREYGFKEVDFR